MKECLHALEVNKSKCSLNGMLRITVVSMCVSVLPYILATYLHLFLLSPNRYRLTLRNILILGKKFPFSGTFYSRLVISNIRCASVNNPKLSESFWAFFIPSVAKEAVLEADSESRARSCSCSGLTPVLCGHRAQLTAQAPGLCPG